MISIKYDKNGKKSLLVMTGVVFFIFLLSGTESQNILLLQQELDGGTNSSVSGIIETAYASDGETSGTEEANEGDEGDDGDNAKVSDLNDDDNGNDKAGDTDISNDNDVGSLKEIPKWDPNYLKESESYIQNSITTEPDEIGNSELQHCIGCSESEIDSVWLIGGDDGLAYLSPTEEGVGGTLGGDVSGRTGSSHAIPVPQPPVPIDSAYSRCIGCGEIDDFEDNTGVAGINNNNNIQQEEFFQGE